MGTFSVQSFLYDFFKVVIGAAYLWLPAITAYFAWKFWLYYIRLLYVSKIDWILLEIKLPREMPKSPQVMEIILSAMITRLEAEWRKINIGKGFCVLGTAWRLSAKKESFLFIFIFQNITEGWWSRRYTLIIRKWKYTRRRITPKNLSAKTSTRLKRMEYSRGGI